MPSTKNRVVVLLTDEQLESLKLQADKENRSLSNLVAIAIKKYLESASSLNKNP
jgi:metal-responsive CopG/Arc/MetJ family transcriptional regulator